MNATDTPAPTPQLHLRRSTVELAAIMLAVLNSAAYVSYVLSYSKILREACGLSSEMFGVLLLGASLVAEALLEIPTGWYSDRVGHARCIQRSFLVLFLHAIVYTAMAATASHMPCAFALIGFGVGELLLALGTALQTGALNSWIVESTQLAGHHGSSSELFSRRRRFINFTWLVAGSMTLILLRVGTWLPLLLSAVLYGLAYSLTRVMMPVAAQPDNVPSTGTMQERSEVAFVGAVKVVARSSRLRLLFVVYAFFWTACLLVTYYFQDLLEALGASASMATVAWMAMAAARLLGSEGALRISRGAKITSLPRRTLVSAQLVFGISVSVLAFGFAGILPLAVSVAVVLLAVARLAQETLAPLLTGGVHDAISISKGSVNRATVESLFEAVPGLCMGGVVLGAIFLREVGSPHTPIVLALMVAGLAVLFVSVPVAFVLMRERKPPLAEVAPVSE